MTMLAYEPDHDERENDTSLDAEHALLGMLLFENEVMDRLDGLTEAHFKEPLHGRLFEAIKGQIAKGLLADPIVLMEKFKRDPGFEALGGMRYLADMLDRAPPSGMADTYRSQVIAGGNRRELQRLANLILEDVRIGEEPTETVGRLEAALLAMTAETRPTRLISAGAAAAQVLAELDCPPEDRAGLETGLAPLDALLGPMLPGDLVLLMGRPSMGKSAAAECIGMNIAEKGAGVIQINGEMTAEQMTRRHMADLCFRDFGFKGPKYSDIRKRAVTYDQRQMLGQARDIIEPMPLLMLKRPGLKLSQLRSIARRQASTWSKAGVKLGALIVDHVGLLHPDVSTRDRYADQTLISNAMKELADELQCVVIGLNQMNRQNEHREDKRPQLSDLRDSGSWEQDADFVIGFYREQYYALRQAEPKKDLEWGEWDRARKSRTIEAIVLKAREGECGTASLWGDVARNAIRGSTPDNLGDLI